MFSPQHKETEATVSLVIDGNPCQVPEGITVAAAMLGYAHKESCRTSFISGEKRAPFCFMGVCHECLVEIDGHPNMQGCAIKVQEGMQIRSQKISEKEMEEQP